MTQANPYCERLRLRFNEYHDGDLSYFLARVVRRHLESCGDCREDYGILDKAVECVRTKPAPDVSPQLLKQVIENLTQPPGGSPERKEEPGKGFVEGLETS